MKKKWMALLIAALAGALTACGGSGEPAKADGNAKAEAEEEADAGETETESQETVIEEQVLFEWEGLKVTATGLGKDEYAGNLILNLLVENDTSYGIGLSMEELFVNGCYVEYSEMSTESIPAGKKANQTVQLGGYNAEKLEEAGIGEIGEIEISFCVRDSNANYYEDASLLYTTERISIQTSAYDRMDTKDLAEGTELYNEGGIRIVAKEVLPYYSCYGLLLYVENATDKDVEMEYYDVSVDGFVSEPGSRRMEAPAGRDAIGTLMLYYDETVPDESALEEIEELEFGLKVYEAAEGVYMYDESALITDTGMLTYTQ